MIAPRTKRTGYVCPERLYRRDDFFRALGIGRSVLRHARRQGIELKTLAIGQKLMIRGADGIAFLEEIAERSARTERQVPTE